MVARTADPQALAGFHVVVDPGRTAAPVGFPQNGDAQAADVRRVAAKRVLPGQAGVAAFDVDMRARRPARQRLAVGRGQRQHDDAVRGRLHAFDDQRASAGVGRGLADAHRLALRQQLRLAAFGVLCRVPFDPQVFGAPERGVGHVGELLGCQAQVRQAARQLLQENLHLHARQVLAHALMRTVPEGRHRRTGARHGWRTN
ncbi:hypothetical protein G6F31_017675 [Rhizopus arrhizus]|nr:hypothetical protein G6F31_017675 [Rhizopus arrhizus]